MLDSCDSFPKYKEFQKFSKFISLTNGNCNVIVLFLIFVLFPTVQPVRL